jgi:hypothetical protein
VALTQLLQGASSKLLRAHVRYHLARLFLDSDGPEFAVRTLNDYLDQDLGVSPLDGEARSSTRRRWPRCRCPNRRSPGTAAS